PAGRKPVPAETRRRRGEPGRPLPVVIGGRVAPPMPRGLDGRMRTCWRAIVTDLVRADAIDHADAGVIEAAAVAWARARQARAAMINQPLLIQTPQGQVPNRLLDIERASWKEFRALAEALPLSPWGRARLGLKGAVSGDQVIADIGLPPRLRALGNAD
ncbi:MAG TPA: P27 family phage terminase small subunit, partial [Patescibacteria group bacterium]|nr:P27 family phage terminase small subunit [Patescibacteria group bacterium]